ncbi:MAG: class I SAM-dependent methyltransferase [Sphingomonadaceae bacterium]
MQASDLKSAQELRAVDGNPEPIAFNDSKIAYVVKRCRGKSVLDLGCVMHQPHEHLSRYWLHRAIREVAADVIGLDLSTSGVLALRDLGYNVVEGDAEAFSFDRQFDVIVVGDLIEHLGNPSGLIRSCLAALAPEGRIIVQTPNPWYWRAIVKAMLYREVPNNPEHTCWFDPRTLRQLVARFGLTLGDTEFQSRYLRDRLMPLPRGIKHTSWSTELMRA